MVYNLDTEKRIWLLMFMKCLPFNMYLGLVLVCAVLVAFRSMRAAGVLASSRVWYESGRMVRPWLRFGDAFQHSQFL